MRRRSTLVVAVVAGSVAACGRLNFGPVDGATTDADVAVDVGDMEMPRFCERLQPAPTFCEDFEQGFIVTPDPGPNATIGQVIENGGALALSPMAYEGNAALEASYANPMPSNFTAASVRWSTTTMVRKVTLDYYIQIVQRPTMGHMECMNIFLEVPGTGFYYYDLDLLSSGFDVFLQEFSPDSGPFMADPVTLGTTLSAGSWHHVVMTLDFEASTHIFAVNGMVLHAGANNYISSPGSITLDTGITYEIGSSEPNSILVDNVALYVE